MVDASDVILYLINASASASELRYLDAELKVLDLIGKPVVVILNHVEKSPSSNNRRLTCNSGVTEHLNRKGWSMFWYSMLLRVAGCKKVV